MTKDEKAQLHRLFAGYFHQDWLSEHSTPGEVLDEFLSVGWSAAELDGLSRAILAYLHENTDDATLDNNLFRELGCYYMPQTDGISARTWLQHISTTLAEFAKKSSR